MPKVDKNMRQVFFSPCPQEGDWRVPVHCPAKVLTIAGIAFDLHDDFAACRKSALAGRWALSRNGIFFASDDMPDPRACVLDRMQGYFARGGKKPAYVEGVIRHQRQYATVTGKGEIYFARERDYWMRCFTLGSGRER